MTKSVPNHYYEHTLEEIAEALGCSRQMVHQYLERAMGKLKRALYRRGITEYSQLSIEEAVIQGLRSGKRPQE